MSRSWDFSRAMERFWGEDYESSDDYDDYYDDYQNDFYIPNSSSNESACSSCESVRTMLQKYNSNYNNNLEKTVSNIRQIDVFKISLHLIKVLKLVDDEAKKNMVYLDNVGKNMVYLNNVVLSAVQVQQSLEVINNLLIKAKKIMEKLTSCLQMDLKSLLNLPEIVVNQIMDILIEQAVTNEDEDVVKFEQNSKEFRKILVYIYRYFLDIFERIDDFLYDPEDVGETTLKLFIPGDRYLRFVKRMGDGLMEKRRSFNPAEKWRIFFGIEDEQDQDVVGFDIWADKNITKEGDLVGILEWLFIE